LFYREKKANMAKLVDAPQLLVELFEEGSRPSIQWVRAMQYSGQIPHIKLGHLVRFDVEQVRTHLNKKAAKSVSK